MQFLKILFWCLLAFIAAVFTIGNWGPVPIRLWGGLVADVNLPLLLLVTFLIGFLPTLLYNHAIRWRLRQRIASSERTIAELRTPATPSVFVAREPVTPAVPGPVAPAPVAQTSAPLAVPTAVPPGVA